MTANRSYNILVVDDEPMNLRVLSTFLSPLYTVKVANSGERAMEVMAGDEKPDLILLDIMMPGKSGFDICRAIKSDPTLLGIPIIFVTAMTDAGSEEMGFKLGAVDYITKPLVPSVVRARVATHLSLHHQQVELEQQVALRTRELSGARLELIHQLGRAAEYRDNDTGMHVIRMAHYARRIAEQLRADQGWVETLFLAAPLHDIGKIGIPDSILLKPGRLDESEWEVMRQHSQIGADIIGLNHSDAVFKMAYAIALNHHESWNGEGYPSRCSGESIPLEARIVACADVFDALVSDRPYKPAWSTADAIAYINKISGTHLDPSVVASFNEVVGGFDSIREQYAD